MTKKELKGDRYLQGDISKMFSKEYVEQSEVSQINFDIKEIVRTEEGLGFNKFLIELLHSYDGKAQQYYKQSRYTANDLVLGYVSEITKKKSKNDYPYYHISIKDKDSISHKCVGFKIKKLQEGDVIVAELESSETFSRKKLVNFISIVD